MVTPEQTGNVESKIEQYFDEQLNAGMREIERPREDWPQEQIDRVLGKYRAHWDVTERDGVFVFEARGQ